MSAAASFVNYSNSADTSAATLLIPPAYLSEQAWRMVRQQPNFHDDPTPSSSRHGVHIGADEQPQKATIASLSDAEEAQIAVEDLVGIGMDSDAKPRRAEQGDALGASSMFDGGTSSSSSSSSDDGSDDVDENIERKACGSFQEIVLADVSGGCTINQALMDRELEMGKWKKGEDGAVKAGGQQELTERSRNIPYELPSSTAASLLLALETMNVSELQALAATERSKQALGAYVTALPCSETKHLSDMVFDSAHVHTRIQQPIEGLAVTRGNDHGKKKAADNSAGTAALPPPGPSISDVLAHRSDALHSKALQEEHAMLERIAHALATSDTPHRTQLSTTKSTDTSSSPQTHSVILRAHQSGADVRAENYPCAPWMSNDDSGADRDKDCNNGKTRNEHHAASTYRAALDSVFKQYE